MQFIICLGIIFLTSCGKQNFPDYEEEEPEFVFEEASESHISDIKPLNGSNARGESLLWLRGNQFYVKVNMRNVSALVRHYQYIHEGSRCPTKKDDLDENGVLDFDEVTAISGEILVPLDKDLSEQALGDEWFPVAGKNGKYFYSEAASLPKMLRDLYSPDPINGDRMTKLIPGEKFEAETRTLIIYGNAQDPFLPIACGTYQLNSDR